MNLDQLKGISRDTSAEAYRVQCDILRRLSARDRGRLMADLIETVNQISAEGVRRRHPDYSAHQIRMALARVRLGDELFRKAFPGIEVAP